MKSSVWITVIAVLVGGFALVQRAVTKKGGSAWPAGAELVCVVPWRAGGGADTMARQLVKYWEPELGANINILNHDGEATLAGTRRFLDMPDDGSVVYIGTQLYMSAGAVLRGADFTMDDFDIINFQQFDPVTIAVHADSPYRAFEDLVNDVRARPGQVRCGFVPGGAPHLAAAALRERLGLEWEDVPFDSGNAYRTALLGGDVDFVFSNGNGDRAIRGRARVLAVADDKRSRIWPDSPTFDEVLKSFDFPRLGSARFVAVRSGVRRKHPDRFLRLVETYKRAFGNPEYAAFRESVGESDISFYRGPKESNKMNRSLHHLLEIYAPSFRPGGAAR